MSIIFDSSTGVDVTLSGGGLAVTNTSGSANPQGVKGFTADAKSSGKYYLEVTGMASSGGGQDCIAFADPTSTLTQVVTNASSGTHGVNLFQGSNGVVFVNGSFTGTSIYSGTIVATDVIGIAIDFDNQLFYARNVTQGGNYNNNSLANPSTQQHGVNFATISSAIPFVGFGGSGVTSGNTTTVNFKGTFVGTIPSGFTAYDTTPSGVTGTMSSTEATDTMVAAGQPPHGTLSVTEATDTMVASGWSQHKPQDLIDSYVGLFCNGNRLDTGDDAHGNNFLQSVVTTPGGISIFSDFTTGFNGVEGSGAGSNGPYFGGTPTAGVTQVQWHFTNGPSPLPGGAIITGLAFTNPAYPGSPQDWGNWTVDGSIDGLQWFTLSTFNLLMTATGFDGTNPGCQTTWSNEIPWSYYRMVWHSGAFVGSRMCGGVLFRIPTNPNVISHDATVTMSSGLSYPGAGPTVANWQDGLFADSYPTASPGSPIINGLVNGQYIQFDWGLGVLVAPFRFRANVSGTAISMNYGTCQWSASNDGTTWTNIGSTFTFNINNENDPIFAVDNPTGLYYRMWRLNFVSTTQTQILGIHEIVFDMVSYKFDVLEVTEHPDTFSGSGYPGAFGFTGQFVTTENPDRFAASGYEPALLTWVSTEAKDIFSAYGHEPVSGHLISTEAPDHFAATGLGRGENGTWASTESIDTLTIIGYTPTSGAMAATENPDTARFIGAGVTTSKQRRILIVA